jgi:hypothetical protein
MKNTIVLVALVFGLTSVSAQDLTSKKGEPILPEAGDWGIGIDATPFLQYAGNFFGKTTSNTAPAFNFFANQTICGKYFVDAQTAYRGSLRLGFGGNTQRHMVDNRSINSGSGSYPDPAARVENVYKQSNTALGLAAGIEKRRGKTRLQGYYGGEVGIYVSSSKERFTYGNALNPVSTSTVVMVNSDDEFAGTANTTSLVVAPGQIGQARLLERKNGTQFSFGLRGFVGVEYFIFPKISLGGEFGWGLGITSTSNISNKWESVGNDGTGGNDEVGITTIKEGRLSNFKVDTDNKNSVWGTSGALRLSFYF